MEIIIKDKPKSALPDPRKYKCSICPKSFAKEVNLEEHILNKHVHDKEFQCTECFETKKLVKFFATSQILKKHIKRTHGIGPPRFECQICFKTFNDSSNFSRHKRSHSQTEIKIHKCDICSKAFRVSNQLQTHLFYVHKRKEEGVKYFKCELCSQEFLERYLFEKHVVRHHVVDKAFECSICSKTFIDQETLEKHMKRHDTELKYFCDVCSKGFKIRKSLNLHLGVEHQKFFYCEKCSKSFKNKSDFDEHISESTQELKCKTCLQCFSSECSLSIHTAHHVNKEVKNEKTEKKLMKLDSRKGLNPAKFQCELCCKTFDRQAYFAAHLKLVHPNADWKCNFENCSKTFKAYRLLNLHQMEHAETKEFVCHVCGKAFHRPDSLNDHEKMHIKEKKYKCENCPKSFLTPIQLRTHIAHNHGGPKPFKCPVINCGTSWANYWRLKMHLVTHQTEKSFKCNLCTTFNAFKSRARLKSHQLRVHSEAKKLTASKYSNDIVFICCANACSFETSSEKEVAVHYNQQHNMLPKVVLFRNNVSPAAALSKKRLKCETLRLIQKRFKCKICSKFFKSQYKFSQHQLNHSST